MVHYYYSHLSGLATEWLMHHFHDKIREINKEDVSQNLVNQECCLACVSVVNLSSPKRSWWFFIYRTKATKKCLIFQGESSHVSMIIATRPQIHFKKQSFLWLNIFWNIWNNRSLWEMAVFFNLFCRIQNSPCCGNISSWLNLWVSLKQRPLKDMKTLRPPKI